MAKPFTFHMQIREDLDAQNEVESLRSFFERPDVVRALDEKGIVHFARVVLIPNDRITPKTKGTFAIQVMLTYDGNVHDLVDWFLETQPFRTMFRKISSIGKVPCRRCSDPKALRKYILQNNLNSTRRELHMGYRLSVKAIRGLFSSKSA